jgi:hypothetical protein
MEQLRGWEKIEILAILPIFFASFKIHPLPQRHLDVLEGGGFRNLRKNIDKIARILIFSQPLPHSKKWKKTMMLPEVTSV